MIDMRIRWLIPHAWRNHLTELVIVAAGVVLGIAATEGVRAWTDAAEARTIRQALDAELARNYYAMELRQRMGRCIDRRGKDLLAWLDLPPERRRPLPVLTGGMGGATPFTTIWQVAAGNGSAAKIPVSDLIAYAESYGAVGNFIRQRDIENGYWTNITDLGARRTLDEREAAFLRG